MRSQICIFITIIDMTVSRFNGNAGNFITSKINASQYQQQEFKITIVIDPGAGENYNTLKADVERTFKTEYEVSRSRNIGVNAEQYNILIETVNAARMEESPVGQQEENPLRITAQKVCTTIMNGSLVVIIYHPSQEKSLAAATSYALGFYNIPVISVSARDAEFSDKNVHSTFLRSIPPDKQQAEVWYALLRKLKYRKVILIHPLEPNAISTANYFTRISLHKIKTTTITYPVDLKSANEYVSQINASNVNIVLFYAATVNVAEMFFDSASDQNVLKSNRVWITNDQALNASNAPTGLLGIRLNVTDSQLKRVALKDSFKTIFVGLKKWYKWASSQNVSMEPPKKCLTNSDASWMLNAVGAKFYEILTKVKIFDPEHRSVISYDSLGDRKGFRYSIVNLEKLSFDAFRARMHHVGLTPRHTYRYVGDYGIAYSQNEPLLSRNNWDDFLSCRRLTNDSNSFELEFDANFQIFEPEYVDLDAYYLDLDEVNVVWPTPNNQKPLDFTLKTHLQVVTVADPPFVTIFEVRDPRSCNLPDTVFCSKSRVQSEKVETYCCSGISIDLLLRLSVNNQTPFTFDLHLSRDGLYGDRYQSINVQTGELETRWNGVVGELAREEADLAVAALTINADRDAVIDFSKPWLYHGITIMEKQKPRLSPIESFMQPYKWPLWLSLFSSVVVIGSILYLLDKFSPFSRFYAKAKPGTFNDENEDDQPLNFSGSMWFVWGVLLDSGIGERTPRSFSARVLGMVWCGFSMIMVASYTANLAAFLVLDQPTKSLTGITDSRLRNPTVNFKYATVESTNVYNYFKSHAELSTMFRMMESNNYANSTSAIQAILNGELDAFIWDSTRLEYEAARSCHLITSGGVFGRAAYGVGLPKNSDWTDIISLAILHMHEIIVEGGEMEDMDARWITGKSKIPCKADDDAPVRLGLMNMRDLFILVAGGMAFGGVFIVVEIFYSKRKAKRLRGKQLGLYYGRIWREKTLSRIQEREIEDICLPNEFFKFCSVIHDDRGRSSSTDSATSLTTSPIMMVMPPEPTVIAHSPRYPTFNKSRKSIGQ